MDGVFPNREFIKEVATYRSEDLIWSLVSGLSNWIHFASITVKWSRELRPQLQDLSSLIWVKLAVSHLQGDAHGAADESLEDALRCLSDRR